jgi:predicted aspartyl protease
LKAENRLSDAKYQLADGSVVQFKRIRVPKFTIGEVIVNNVTATVVQNGKPLLLGKSFLDTFKAWKIDNEKQLLTVELF